MTFRILCFALVLALPGTVTATLAAPPAANTPYQILLRSRQFIPAPGVEPAAAALLSSAPTRRHVLVQLNSIPDTAAQAALAQSGIRLLHYIPDHAWIASAEPGPVVRLNAVSDLRWLGSIAPADKLPERLLSGKPMRHAILADGSLALQVKYFDDVSVDEATAAITRRGGVVAANLATLHRLGVRIRIEQLSALAAEDVVEWIEEYPPDPTPSVDTTRSRIRVNEVQAAPYNLTGSGVRLGIWDCTVVGSHVDFSGRLTLGAGQRSTPCTSLDSTQDHATHVAGIMAGSGVNSQNQGGAPFQWKGMAPSAQIYSYDFLSPTATVPSALSLYIDLAQNSWGYAGDCDTYGNYTFLAPFYDQVVFGNINLGSTRRIPVVFSAGNAQGACGPFNSITPPGTAKNVITVGATNGSDNGMAYFSSWGPTDDGRTKPDLVAPGTWDGLTGIRSTIPVNTYGFKQGTSMAAPVVSGMLALMLQQYRITTGQPAGNPYPSTLKALAVHGAVDLGNPGPDYKFGWGRVDAKNSIDLIQRQKFVEGLLPHNQTVTYTVNIASCVSSLKATLVWDDPAAADMSLAAYVNDLDLALISPTNVTHRPWLLDPNLPSNNASNGIDARNNVEQVLIANPLAGMWTIKVSGQVPQLSPQRFSLVSEALPTTPTLTTLSQPSGTPGTQIVLHGREFGCAQGSGVVTFASGVNATVNSWTNDAITVTVPLNAETGNVTVTTNAGVSNGLNFGVLRSVYLPVVVRNFPPSFEWIDASDGTLIANGDEAVQTVTLPFAFPYGGTNYTTVTVSANGFISFGALPEAYPTATCVPSAMLPNNAVYAFWTDLDPTHSGVENPPPPGAIWYKSLGSSVVIEWQNVSRYGTTELETFEIILNSSGYIFIQYLSVTNFLDLVIGVEDQTGSNGAQSYCHQSDPLFTTGTAPSNGLLLYFSAP